MLSLCHRFNHRNLRRHRFWMLLISASVCQSVVGDDVLLLTPPAQSSTTLQIRTATRSWDDSKPEPFQPALRFRPASTKLPAKTAENKSSDETPLVSEDSWVARDAVNVQQPLRDPANPTPNVPKTQAAVIADPDPVSPAPPTRLRPDTSQLPPHPTAVAPRMPSATLTKPIAKPTAKTPTDGFAPQHDELASESTDSTGTLQLVQPADLAPLRSIESATSMSAGDLDPGDVDEPLTAVETMLEPALNSPAQRERNESDHATSADSVTNRPAARGGIEFRRLQIERDGTPTQDPSPLPSTLSQRETASASKRTENDEGNNEPLVRDETIEPVEVAPNFDAAETARLRQAPSANTQTPPKRMQQVDLDYTGRPSPALQVSTSVRRLQPAMRSCLTYYHGNPEDASARSNWGMMHQMMVYGVDTNITTGRNHYNAIAWIAGNNACRGQRILARGPRGIEAKSGVGLQGHQGQLLAVLSLCDVPAKYPLYVGRERFMVEDLVREEMATCKSGEELTFTLIGLSHYLSTDEQWRSADGQSWDFERLIREELSQPVVGAACGGTHRLMGFAHALRHRRAEGGEIAGQWLRAEKFLEEFVTYTYQLQNRDGSMSTSWFEKPEDNGDMDRKVQTTGHMVEWLLTFTPDEDLQNPRLVAAIRFLLGAMNSQRDHDWQIGPKGHALRSLAMYYDRVYRSGPAWANAPAMARSTNQPRR